MLEPCFKLVGALLPDKLEFPPKIHHEEARSLCFTCCIRQNYDEDTRTLPVRASVDNAKLLLKPQMFAHMTLRTGQAEIFAVPSDAIQKAGEMNIAYVRRSGTEFEERRVKTGETVGSYIQVVDGLKEGEPVVVKGSLQLQGEAIQRLGK